MRQAGDEVTPEMIEVGVSEFVHHDPRFDDEEGTVRRIFLAMLSSYGRCLGLKPAGISIPITIESTELPTSCK